jgi:hypothetical protein
LFGESKDPKLIYGGGLHYHEGKEKAFGRMPPKFDAERLTYNDYIIQPSTFWTRSLWECVGELNESYHYLLDWDWLIRASKVCNFIPVQDYFSIYRIHENHKSSNGGVKRYKEVVKVVEEHATEEWISAFKDVYENISQLKNGISTLLKLRIYRLRYLFFTRLYMKHGQRVDVSFRMF